MKKKFLALINRAFLSYKGGVGVVRANEKKGSRFYTYQLPFEIYERFTQICFLMSALLSLSYRLQCQHTPE